MSPPTGEDERRHAAILETVVYAADVVRKRFVPRRSTDGPTVDSTAVAEGNAGDDD